jgi:hypothetical protein
VPENQPGVSVGKIEVVDQDVNNTYQLFLSGSASSQFVIQDGVLFVSHLIEVVFLASFFF